jgi:succinyl-diaminopimelate desuccinylase
MNETLPVWDDCIEFCRALLQTPSLPGQEGDVARLVKTKMEELAYDDVWIDDVGNVIGLVKGRRDMASVCFTAHMDIVDPGDEAQWEYPPYGGVIADGHIHGRGASDLKGPLATQVYVPELLRMQKVEHGDVYVIEVVQEEVGGLGSTYLDDIVMDAIDFAINGEPSSNKIKIAHKGRVELAVRFKGVSAHASMPELALNPIYDMAEFILRLLDLQMRVSELGPSTATPTICMTDQKSSNATPGEGTIVIDWRTLPGETEETLLETLGSIASDRAEISVAEYPLTTYTQVQKKMRRFRVPFSIDRNHPLVEEAAKAVTETLKETVEISTWPFCTDCGCFSQRDIPIIGFSPGDDKNIHTNRERISLEKMKQAMRCYPAIVARVSRLPGRERPARR